jgi:hypothetical protein
MVKPGGAVPKEGDEEPEVEFFDGLLDGTILEEADPMRITGFPMESLFYVDEYSLLLGTIQLLPSDDKLKYAVHSHSMARVNMIAYHSGLRVCATQVPNASAEAAGQALRPAGGARAQFAVPMSERRGRSGLGAAHVRSGTWA